MTAVATGGAPTRAPLPPASPLVPLIVEWGSARGLPLATASSLARRAVDGDPAALLAFGTEATLAYARTHDPETLLRTAIDAGRTCAQAHVARDPDDGGRKVRRAHGGGWRTLRQGLVALALTFIVLVAYGAFIDNRWYKVVAIEGASMEPTISEGDAIVLTRPPETIEAGMILTLEVEGQIVTHRVVVVRPDGTFVTKGDANRAADDFTGLDVRVVGQYRMRIPELGAILSS